MLKYDDVYAQICAGDMTINEFQKWVLEVEENNCNSGYVCGGIEGYSEEN